MLICFLKCCFCLLTFQRLANAQLDGAGRESLSECSSYEIHESCGNVNQFLDVEVITGEGPDSFKGLCNSTVISNKTSGTIESPNYPMNYDPNSCFSWYITIPEGKAISIVFNSTYAIEEYDSDCEYDSLKFNGYKRHCGYSPPATFQTKNGSLNVYFITDGSNQARGFSFAWYTVDDSYQHNETYTNRTGWFNSDNTIDDEDRSYSESSGYHTLELETTDYGSGRTQQGRTEVTASGESPSSEESLSDCLRVLSHEYCYDDFLCVYRSAHGEQKVYGIGRKDLAECMCRNLTDLRLETARCINLTIVNVNEDKTITIPEHWSVEPKNSADDQPAGTSIKKSTVSYILMLYMVAVLFCP